WHKPGLGGSHLTAEDKAATARNKERLELYRQATTPERIRELTAGGH
ncbi:MAG TPA: glycosyltransferase family 2 protein, partial [Mycobacterium sp.]